MRSDYSTEELEAMCQEAEGRVRITYDSMRSRSREGIQITGTSEQRFDLELLRLHTNERKWPVIVDHRLSVRTAAPGTKAKEGVTGHYRPPWKRRLGDLLDVEVL